MCDSLSPEGPLRQASVISIFQHGCRGRGFELPLVIRGSSSVRRLDLASPVRASTVLPPHEVFRGHFEFEARHGSGIWDSRFERLNFQHMVTFTWRDATADESAVRHSTQARSSRQIIIILYYIILYYTKVCYIAVYGIIFYMITHIIWYHIIIEPLGDPVGNPGGWMHPRGRCAAALGWRTPSLRPARPGGPGGASLEASGPRCCNSRARIPVARGCRPIVCKLPYSNTVAHQANKEARKQTNKETKKQREHNSVWEFPARSPAPFMATPDHAKMNLWSRDSRWSTYTLNASRSTVTPAPAGREPRGGGRICWRPPLPEIIMLICII